MDHLLHGVLLLLLPLAVVLLLLVMGLVVLLSRVLVLRRVATAGGHVGRSAGEVDVDPPGVVLGGILEAEFATDLFDAGFQLLHMVRGVVSFADDSVGRR